MLKPMANVELYKFERPIMKFSKVINESMKPSAGLSPSAQDHGLAIGSSAAVSGALGCAGPSVQLGHLKTSTGFDNSMIIACPLV